MRNGHWFRVLSFAIVFAILFRPLPAQEETTDKPAAEKEAGAEAATGARERRTVKLPGTVEDLVVAGSGKYVLAHLKGVQKLAIIDVKEAKVLKYIPVTSPDILFAGGAESLFIVLPDQKIIQRWSLTTLEREVAVPLPAGGMPATLVMGHASLGPILMGMGGDTFSRSFTLLHAKTLQPLPAEKDLQRGRGFECGAQCIVRASANGQVFTSWRTGVSPTGFFTMVLGSGRPECFYEHNSLGLLTPSADGARIYTGAGIYNNKTKPVSANRENRHSGALLPSVTGDYFLKIDMPDRFSSKPKGGTSISLFLAGDTRPIVTLADAIPSGNDPDSDRGRSPIYLDKRIMYFPDLSALTVLNDSDDALDIVKLDLSQELERSGIDYLFVASKPPLSAAAGKRLEYQVVAKSKKGGVKIKLESGPEGMKVDEKGMVSWAVPAGERGENDVILAVSDSSGQEVFHTFRLTVSDSSGAANAKSEPATTTKPPLATAIPKASSPVRPPAPPATDVAGSKGTTSPPREPTAAKLPALFPAKFEGDKTELKLPAAAEKMELGGGGRYLVLYLKSLRKIAVVDLCEAKIAGYIPADDNNVQFAAGAEKVVVVLGEKSVITRWNLSTLQREVTAPLEGRVSAVAIGSASAGPIVVSAGGEDHFPGSTFKLYDLAKLRPLDVKLPQQFSGGGTVPPRVSADGRTICMPGSFGLITLVFDGRQIQANSGERSGSNYGMGIPSPDGQVIYSGGFRYSQAMRLLSKPDQNSAGILIPAAHGRLYLSVQLYADRRRDEVKQKLAVHIEGDSRPLITLDDFELSGGDGDFYGHQGVPVDKRIVLVPDAKVIATLAPTFDKLELRRFDLDQALDAAGIDFLFVTSRPPVQAKPGESVKYQVEVKSKKGGVKYRLEAGPEGMQLSPAGLLTWKVPGPAADAVQHSVILAISDASEQEVFHTFQISVEGSAPKPATSSDSAGGHQEFIEKFTEDPVDSPFPPSVRTKGIPRPMPPAPKPYASLVGKQRTWTEASSERKIEGRFLGLEGGKVKIVTTAGKEFAIPVERLSRQDLVWILGGSETAAEKETK